jgi:uncharacterized small protein (DUF1192 family)
MAGDVLQIAQTDRAETEARIANLREEIEREEAHIAEVDAFVAMYQRYAASVGEAEPAPAGESPKPNPWN